MNFDEIELMSTFGKIAFKLIGIFFHQMIMMWKSGTGRHFIITENSL